MVEEKIVDIDELFLDPENYRIDFTRYNTEEKAVERLYLDENIVGMIEGIVAFPGLFPHEKMIVVPRKSGGYKVVEGNRRLLAAKTILGLIKPPAKYERKITESIRDVSEDTKASLKKIGVVVYEQGDKDYLKILANKHSSVSYQRWGQISQWHFFNDLFDVNEKNLGETAKDLGKNKSEVANYIKYYNLFNYIRSLSYWDEKDLRDEIESNTLKATKFTRALGFTAVQNALRIKFTSNLELQLPGDELDTFNEILCRFAEAALIRDKNDDDFIYTRSEGSQIVDLINGWIKEIEDSKEKEKKESGEGKTSGEDPKKGDTKGEGKNQGGKKGGRRTTRRGRGYTYWGPLECNIDNDRLMFLSDEASRITVSSFPGAAIMLSRGLIESCLRYQIDKYGLWDDFTSTRRGGYSLDSLITYALKKKEDIFNHPDLAESMKYLQGNGGHRQYMNDIMHGNPISPHAAAVEAMAGDLRELIKSILADEE